MNAAIQSFVDAAIAAAAQAYGVPAESITGTRGVAEESFARQVAMYVVMVYGKLSSRAAAPYFERQDSTLRHARIIVRHRVANYPEDKARVAAISRLAIDKAARPPVHVDALMPGDIQFVHYLVAVLTSPQHASQAADLRRGQSCITYSPGGALALHPFDGKP